MFRYCSGVVALAVMVVGLPTAQAADTTLTLACQGTVTETMMGEEKKPEPTSMGIILNFTSRTVKGFGTPVKITAWDDLFVEFSEDNKSGAFVGNIDRITGTLEGVVLSPNERRHNNDKLRAEMQASTTDVLI